MERIIKRGKFRSHSIHAKDINSVIAYAASLLLTGVPPQVCESVISEVYCSIKRSLETMIS